MKKQEELAQEFLKVIAKNNLRKKQEENNNKKKLQEVKKNIKETEKTMKHTIMQKSETPVTLSLYKEKEKIDEMSELVLHSKKGIEKISEEFEKSPGKIYEEESTPEATPKAISAEKILETPLSPEFKKKEIEVPVPRFIKPGEIREIAQSQEINPNLIVPDLGKINDLVKSPSISIIQCDGTNEEIKITRNGKIEKTGIKLNEEEIKTIIRKFSDRAGKEITRPVLKVNFSNLEMTAIISEFSGNRFVISKKS